MRHNLFKESYAGSQGQADSYPPLLRLRGPRERSTANAVRY